jgi:hypothetical protein
MGIAKGLETKDISTNYLFSEYITEWLYNSNPIPRIEMNTKKIEDMDYF